MKICIWFLILAVGFQASAGEKGAYRPMTAANRLEREIQWAWFQLPFFLKACGYSKDCGLSDEQKKIVSGILANQKNYNLDSLVFVSERSRADLFQATNGEVHRLAVTGDSPDSKVFINADQESKLGKSRGLAFWMGILAHEMVHHLGIPDDARRVPDQLGSAIAAAAEKFLISIDVPEESGDVNMQILNPPAPMTTQALEGFPEGILFHVFTQDGAVSLDLNLSSLTEDDYFCNGKQIVSVRVAPELVQVNRDVRGENLYRAQLGFNSEVICMDKGSHSLFRQAKLIRHAFALRKQSALFVDLQGSFDWGLGSDEDTFGKYERGEILSLQAPPSVQAGGVLRISAQVRFRDGLDFIGCSAFLFSPVWPQTQGTSPGVVEPERCVYKKIAPQTYVVEMEKDIPATAAPLDLELQLVCLTVAVPGADCMASYPKQRTVIKVLNPNPSPEIALTDVRLDGVREVSKVPGQIRFESSVEGNFILNFTVKNTVSIENAVIDMGIIKDNGNPMGLNVPFSHGPNAMVTKAVFTPKGADLLVSLEIHLGRVSPEINVVSCKLEGIRLVTTDFHSGYLNLENQNLSIKAGSAP